MRSPKRGDRCEHAPFNTQTMRHERDCQVRHLEGKPPGQLVVVKIPGERGKWNHVLMCGTHAQNFQPAQTVRRQKPRPADADQEVLL